VIASGRSASLGAVPGMSDHAFPFKGVGDAMALRSHVIQQLENAEVCGDEARRRWYVSFVVVGAGFSGVEVAGEINDLVRTSRHFYPNVSPEEITVTLVSAKDHILPELNPDLRAFARQKMEAAGITIVVNARATSATAEGVWLHDDRQLRGATVVSTVGSRTPALVERMTTPKHGGLLVTDADMRLPGRTNAWAIGDCARIVNSFDGQFSPATGQFAERQGRQVAATRSFARASSSLRNCAWMSMITSSSASLRALPACRTWSAFAATA
jgi:NADH dehydrogenase